MTTFYILTQVWDLFAKEVVSARYQIHISLTVASIQYRAAIIGGKGIVSKKLYYGILMRKMNQTPS